MAGNDGWSPLEAVDVVFGDTAEDKPRMDVAVAVASAACKHAIVRVHSLSSLAGVRGSRTGKDTTLQTIAMSTKREAELKQNKHM